MKNKKLLFLALIIGLFVNASLHAQNPLSVSDFNEAGNMSNWAYEAGIYYKGFTFSNTLGSSDVNTGNVSNLDCTHNQRYKLKNNEILTFPEITKAGKIHVHGVSGASGGVAFTAELILEKNTGSIATPNWVSVETCKSTVIGGGSTACGILTFGEGYLSADPVQYRIVNKSGSSIWLWAIEAEDYTAPDPTAIAPSAMNGNISSWESLAAMTGTTSITTSTIGVSEGFNYYSTLESIECRTANAVCQDGNEHTRRLRLYRNSDAGCYLEFPKLSQAGIVKVCISNGHGGEASYKLSLEKKNASEGWDLVEEFSIENLPGSGGDKHTSISFGKSTFTGSPGSYTGGISSGPVTFRLRNTTPGSGNGSGSIYLLNLSVSPYNDATGIEYGASSEEPTPETKDDLPDPAYAYATPINHTGAPKWQSELVKMDKDGRLTYNKDSNGYILPDFSHAGYKNGDKPIPTGGNVDKILTTLEPSATKQNDAIRIQEAINNAASAGKDVNGIRGVILLKKGKYYLSQQTPVNLNVEGVILRGEGYTNDPEESTVIYDDFDYGRRSDTQPNWGTTLTVGNSSGGNYWTTGRSQQTEVLDDTVHVGSYTVKIRYNENNTWNEGDLMVLDFPVGDKWFETVEWGGNTDGNKKWSTGMMNGISYHRYIKKVEHDGTTSTTLTMDAPVFYSLAKADAGGAGLQVWKISQSNTYKNIGIENLRIQILLPGEYTGKDEHHSTNVIRFSYAENCWAKNVATAGFVQAGFVFSNSSRITIKDSYSLDPIGDLAITNGGERYYNFNFNDNSQLILLDNCYARGGRHNYVSNGTSRVSGIVVYNCKSEYSRTSSEGHRLWTQGMLFDSYEDFNPAGTFGILGFYNRNNMGSGHGYSMAHGVMWNANTRTPAEFQANNGYPRTGNKGYFLNEKPPTADNYSIGCFAEYGDAQVVRKYDNTAGRRTLGYVEGSNKPGLEPLSLYAAQLHSRNLPPLVEYIRPTLMKGNMSDWTYDGTGGQEQGFVWSEGEGTLPAGSVGSTLSGNQDGHTQRFKLTKNNTLQFPGLTDAGNVTVHLHSGAVKATYPDGGLFTLVLEKKNESEEWVVLQTQEFEQPAPNSTLCTKVVFDGGENVEGISDVPVNLRIRNDNASIGSLWLMQIEATDYQFTKAIISQPEGFEICAGKTDTLLVETSGKDATYQWYKDNIAVEDATKAMYILSNATHEQSGIYTVKVSYPGEENLLTSEPVTVTISEFAAPAITNQPKKAVWTIGESYTLEVSATGGTSYQWYKEGKELTGENTASYTKASAELSDAGLYKVEVFGACGDPVMSNEVEIKVGDGSAIFIEEMIGRVDDWQGATWTGSTTIEYNAGEEEGFKWSQLDLEAQHLSNPPIPVGKLTVNTMNVDDSGDGHPAHQKRVRLSEHESVELPKVYNAGTITVHMSPGTPGNAQVGPDGESVNGRDYTLVLDKFDEGTSKWVEVETLNFHMAPASNSLCVTQTFGLSQQISAEPVLLRLRNPMELYEDNRTIGSSTTPANPNSFGIWFLMVEGTPYIESIPVSTTWSPQDGSTDWTLSSNWSDGVPGNITKVTIPKRTSYPVLTQETEVNTIYFEAGTELGRQDLLTYEKAFVDYDFGKGTRSIHFHTLALPLMEAYPGDFTFGGQPDSYIQTLQTDESGRGKWVPLSGGNSAAFSAGTGFALSLDPDKDADKGLGLSEGILRLPFFDEASGVDSQVHPNHTYNAWTSTFSNPYGEGSYNVTRSQNAYKLAGAEVAVNPKFGQSGNNVIALVGNPFMSTIDFNQLQADNSNLIKNNYQVWTKAGAQEGYAGYSPDGNWGLIMEPEMDNLITPLQGFVVERNGEVTGSLNFNLLNIAADESGILRNSTVSGNKVDIVAKNGTASVRTFIAKREGGSVRFSECDARKLINNLTDVPEIYTLKSSDKGMVSVGANIYDGADVEYPVGLATSYRGDITLTFSGMDNCDLRVVFTDNVMNKTIELTGLSNYDYTFSHAPEVKDGEASAVDNRFSLRMVSSTSGIEDELYGPQNLTVYPENSSIWAVSNGSPISGIKVYNLSGSLVYSKSKINAISYKTRTGFAQGVYIVEVKTENGVERKKIIITNH